MNRIGNALPLRGYRLFLGALLLIVGIGALIAGGCGGGGGGKGGGSTVVTGQVLNSAAGDAPVEGAKITIGGVTTLTRTRDNADATHNVGSYSISGPAINASTAVIDLTGTTAQVSGGAAVQTIAFTPPVGNGTNPTHDFFVNIGQIRGRVLLPNGQPATTAFVTVSATGESQQVNSNGVFLLDLIPTGTTQVFAVQGTASATKPVTVQYGLSDIGDVLLVDDPNPNPPGQPFTITGTITVPDVGAVSDTRVVLFRNGIQVETTLTNVKGAYFFFVPPGNYTIRAVRTGYQDGNSAPFIVADPNTPVRTDLTLVPL